MITKAELLSLSRDELVARAEAAGLPGATTMTRADLVDGLARAEGIDSSKEEAPRERPRGFFGRARALIARVIEKGLHLPSAISFRDDAREQQSRAPLPTVTLARIYLSQGHRPRALEVLRDVLARHPDDEEARTLMAELVGTGAAPAAPATSSDPRPEEPAAKAEEPAPPPASEPPAKAEEPVAPPASIEPAAPVEAAAPPVAEGGSGPKPMLDDAPLPERYDVDEAVIMPVDPTTAYLYWELRPSTVARLRAGAPGGRFVVRLAMEAYGREIHRDVFPDREVGDVFLDDLPDNARLQATLGYLVDGVFDAIAQGPAAESPPATQATRLADALATWRPIHTELLPGPLPAPIALSIALAHTSDPTLRPQLDVLANVPGFEAALRPSPRLPANDVPSLGEDEPVDVLPPYLRGSAGSERAPEGERVGAPPAAARRIALGSSELAKPLGSSGLSDRRARVG